MEVTLRVRHTELDETLQTLQDETAGLFQQLEEHGSADLDAEKGRVDGLVRDLKRLIEEKTALSR